MKKFVFIFAYILLSCTNGEVSYREFKAAQDYSVPLFKPDHKNKAALFVFPHPDDEIVCGGTIDFLKNNGWKVYLITLTQGEKKESITRLAEWKKAVRVLKIDSCVVYNLPNNSWDNVINNKIDFWYDNTDSVESIIYNTINNLRPSLMFTYDTALGGYGHPEHRMSALDAFEVFKKHKMDSSFSVKEIYQITLPEKLEQLLVGSTKGYKNAQTVTHNLTLPDPTIAFDIYNNWPIKRNAASCYSSQASVLRKFYLLPDLKDTIEHYNTFNREYYFTIKY